MNYISSYFQKKVAERSTRRFRRATEEAAVLFQVQEYGGELWLTYNGGLVCPCEMLKDGAMEALGKMRELYANRVSENG